MTPRDDSPQRHIGLAGATGIGVGAIVGGGILALAGAAFAATGPSAMLAFALNGVVAVLTALSFAELSAAFPQSGGTYTFAKKVLSVEAAFAVGWVVWFASIVAAVLYALGFGYFAAAAVRDVWIQFGTPPGWLAGRVASNGLAVAAIAFYMMSLLRSTGGGGSWANVGKLVVFGLLIAAGLAGMTRRPIADLQGALTPFFASGATGLFEAMGFTFIALQGFDLIAAVAGEIRTPERVIPRAMLISLAIALAVYLPLLLVIATAELPSGESVTEAAAAEPETIVAVAAASYLGPFGFWLVVVAAILSMLSALGANLFAASRMAQSMARDRTLPHRLSRANARGTPGRAVVVTAGIVAATVLVVPDVSAAGAASSLIFLVSFAIAHWIGILARQRGGDRVLPFRVPFYPIVPLVGGLACVSLAIYEGLAVPAAGQIAGTWLGVGGLLYMSLFARRARVVDAAASAFDPDLVRLRGRSPLVLVPIANPANAASMIAVAHALAPPAVGRVLLLSVVVPPERWQPGGSSPALIAAQSVLGEALGASAAVGLFPEALTTLARHPWTEIGRVARVHRCECILLGLSNLETDERTQPLEELLSGIDSDVAVLHAPSAWQLSEVRNVLVAVAGRGAHDELRARMLGSLLRTGDRHVKYLHVLSPGTPARDRRRVKRELKRIARDEARDSAEVEVLEHDDPAATLIEQAAGADLLVLGMQRLNRRTKLFGPFVLGLARAVKCPIIMISRRG